MKEKAEPLRPMVEKLTEELAARCDKLVKDSLEFGSVQLIEGRNQIVEETENSLRSNLSRMLEVFQPRQIKRQD